VSGLAVARNLALAAGFAAIPSLPERSLSTDEWLGIGLGFAALAIVALGVMVFALAREVGMLRLQLSSEGALEIAEEGPELGSEATELSTRIPRPAEELGIAVFTSEGCHLCQTLEPAVESLAREPDLNLATFDEIEDADMWRAANVPGSPFAVALGDAGVVLSKGTFNNLAQLESLVATALRRRSESARRVFDAVVTD
jgi:hypothetical protein